MGERFSARYRRGSRWRERILGADDEIKGKPFSLTANIYRSKTATAKGEKVPVVMCAHPYNNHLGEARQGFSRRSFRYEVTHVFGAGIPVKYRTRRSIAMEQTSGEPAWVVEV